MPKKDSSKYEGLAKGSQKPGRSQSNRICVTRAIKNAKYIQQIARHIIPKEPPEGYISIIPVDILMGLHTITRPQDILSNRDIANLLQKNKLPQPRNSVSDPLFNGTLYFVRITFNTPSGAFSVSNLDVQTAINYSNLAVIPISQYASQYGFNSVSVSQNIIQYSVNLQGTSFNDTDLQGWVNNIASQNNLPSNSCVVVLNYVPGVVNTNASPPIEGYHSLANVPYIFSNVYGHNLTVQDSQNVYAQILSHEIAEVVVDPLVDGRNPEVCDACAGNCNFLWYDFFDSNNAYLGSTQTFPPPFNYAYYINAIVQPNSVTQCPPTSNACNYGPTIVRIGNPSLIQSNYGSKGNFEVVVPFGNQLQHFWRNNDDPNLPWNAGPTFASGVTGGPSLIRSNFGTQGNFEVVVPVGNPLQHFWRNNDDPNLPWNVGPTFASGVTGGPSLIRSNFGTQGNFEVVVPINVIDGNALQHWWRNNDDPNLPWNAGPTFAELVGGDPSLIQSNYGSKGNFEVVVFIGNALQHWWRNNDDPNLPWNAGPTFASGATGCPSLIQSNYGSKGNFEVVVPFGNQLQHWWRNNDDPNLIWNQGPTFASGISGKPSLIQSNFGSKGNFEVVVPFGNQLQHWWRNNDDPNLIWNQGPTFG